MSSQPYSRNVIETVIKNFDALISSTSVKSVLEHNKNIARLLHYEDDYGLCNFFKLKNTLNIKSLSKWNRVASILKTLDDKTNQKEYSCRNKIQEKQILVIGGGISGLRVSIELLLLGAKVICVEKRDEFSRNNVIHLWPNVINDMYTFEAKRFYGQFCVGSIDHVSIRQLQLILLKIAIIYGLKFYPNTTFTEICPRTIDSRKYKCNPQSCDCCCHMHGFGAGAYAHFMSSDSYSNIDLNKQSFDVIIGCDGRRNTFSRYFPRNNRRGKLAIGLTANFVNTRTEEEAHCPEISGISRIYNQKWFKDLQDETDIELENLVYYRDETHYFVMTPTKASLLRRGVLKSDFGDSHQLLHLNNIDTNRLIKYSKDAAEWSSKLKRLEFARNSNNMPDVALFDFTSMYSATNASCAKKIYLQCCDNPNMNVVNFKYMLLLLCGDSLLEPFWPTGSGAGRGFLSALDAAWTVAQWFSHVSNESSNIDSILTVISKREYVYRLLAQTSPENTTSKNFTLDPQTRYKNLNILNKTLQDIKAQVRHLIIDDSDLDVKNYLTSYESKRARRATVGINPEDILQAKSLLAKSDECNPISLDFQKNFLYSVPSSNDTLSKSYCCDTTKPLEVIELKPKNYDSTKRHVDVQPRNNDYSNLAKKNHHARNHFFNSEKFANNYFSSSSLSSSYEKQCNLNDVNCTNSDKRYSSQSVNHQTSSSNKENFPIPDFKQMFDFDIDDKRNKKNHSSNSSKSRLNMINDHNDEFEKGLTQKPKKSSDIMEKAYHLAQKFQELNKPFVPNLSKVGKIEENDWNVKMWNSNDIFAPKLDKNKQNLINENSKDLLQSRITQLNNNMEYKKEIPKIINTKISQEYVNLLTNEVCQKFSNSGVQQNETTQPQKLIEQEVQAPIDLIDSKMDKKSSEFLKPIGLCKRCNTTLLAIDRVTFSGQNFHKNCLTCKSCSVRLRQDEVMNEDYTCKICKVKSRSNSIFHDETKSLFMNNSLNLSLIEAKTNFLVNVEQIDLRERAEFEIMESEKFNVNPPLNLNEPIDGFCNDHQNDKGQISNINLLTNEEESSELTESDVNYSDNNYTDDENSDSEEFNSKTSLKEDFGSGFTSLICTNNDDSDLLVDSTGDSNTELVELASDSDAFNNVCATRKDEDSVDNVDDNKETETSSLNHSLFRCALNDAESMPSYHLNSCDNNENLIGRDLDREKLKFPSLQETTTTTINETTNNQQNNSNEKQFPYRYTGQFTEKFYRSLSQPSLYDQLNMIDYKLKKKRAPKQQTLSQDLPFADSFDEVIAGTNVNNTSPKQYNSAKLTRAPFARIDDV